MAGGEYLVCFSEKCEKEDIKQHVFECLTLAKFNVLREEFEGKTLLTIGAPFEILAQKVRLVGTSCLNYLEQSAWEYVFPSLCCFANRCETILTNDILGRGRWFGENHKD